PRERRQPRRGLRGIDVDRAAAGPSAAVPLRSGAQGCCSVMNSDQLDQWLEALGARHRSSFTSSEFLKALRALSARYVERRGALPARSPLDTAGKRAAFAAFYAP